MLLHQIVRVVHKEWINSNHSFLILTIYQKTDRVKLMEQDRLMDRQPKIQSVIQKISFLVLRILLLLQLTMQQILRKIDSVVSLDFLHSKLKLQVFLHSQNKVSMSLACIYLKRHQIKERLSQVGGTQTHTQKVEKLKMILHGLNFPMSLGPFQWKVLNLLVLTKIFQLDLLN